MQNGIFLHNESLYIYNFSQDDFQIKKSSLALIIRRRTNDNKYLVKTNYCHLSQDVFYI